MVRRAPLTSRHERALREIAERGLKVAESLSGKLGECRTTAETLRLAEAFTRISDEVREAIALEADLQRERQRAELARRRQAPSISTEPLPPSPGPTPPRRLH